MAGATLDFQDAQATGAINRAAAALDNPAVLLRDIGEYLLNAHAARFQAQQSPDGTPWAPLSPAYARRKRKRQDRILELDGHLKNTLRYLVSTTELLFGSNRVYAAIHQFGGPIDIPARSQQNYFKQGRDGTVGNRFVSKRKSNFAQWGSMAGYTINMPARPWLGTSTEDDAEITRIADVYLSNAISGGGA